MLVNGFLSESFNIERGCRQGDGLSPYLFLLCAEVLPMMLCNDEDVKGIKIGDAEYCISQYAFKNLDLYASISGLKVNVDKTNAIWIGLMKKCQQTF